MNQLKHGHQVQKLYNTRFGRAILPILNKKIVSQIVGKYHDTALSRRHIVPFIKKFGINMDEALEPNPRKYSSFNQFFIRKLKADARPICSDPLSVASCADGALLVIEDINKNSIFPVKNVPFNLATFLNDAELAEQYSGGTVLIFRLAPWDYHRFHFPFECSPDPAKRINGKYDSVDHAAFGPLQPLHTNERQLVVLNTLLFDEVIAVPVGALCVGKIIHTYTPFETYKKGDEFGYFCFGGSTVVLVFKKDTILIRPDIRENSAAGKETIVKMGELVGYQKNTTMISTPYINMQK